MLYMFTQSGSSWTQQLKLAASDGANQDLFGTSVALSGTVAIIGAPGHFANGRGAAYLFIGSGTSWAQQTPDISASDGAKNDAFGKAVSLNGGAANGSMAIIGAPVRASSQGAAYAFAFSPWTVTSANSTTFTVGLAGTFAVTTTTAAGSPTPPSPALSETGALPAGVTFTDNGNGTATIAGTPAAGTGDAYPITITASGAGYVSSSQSFTLTVNQAPAITSSNGTTFTVGTAGSFAVTATGFPAFPPAHSQKPARCQLV